MSEQKHIIRGRWVLQDPDQLLVDGAVVVDGPLIEHVGPWQQVRELYPDLPVLGGDQHAILPGFVNAHHHSNGVTAVQQGVPDRLLELWLLSLAGRRRTGTYLATLLSAARLLQTGVTAVVDVHSGRGAPEEFEAGVRQALRAYDEAGLRAAFAVGMTEKSFLTWDEDAAFLGSLPAEMRALAEQKLPGDGALTTEDYFAIMDQLWRSVRSHSRIAVWFGPPGPQWVTDDFMGRIAAQAEAYTTGIQTHLLESVYEKLHGPRAYGQATLHHLSDLGILSPRISFAHGVWLTETEIELLAESGAHLSHNPSSNLRLRAGMAPLNALLEGGVSVALGMDGTTLNDDEDIFAEMRLAANLHRTPRLDGPAPAPRDIWRMATIGGARLFQAAGHIGRLAPGYVADIVLLRLDRITWPWVAPEIDPRQLLLMRASARDVDTVLVEGEVVLRDGQPTRFDLAEAGAALVEELSTAAVPRENIEMIEKLMPYLAAHYRRWPFPELEPYEAFNSRR
jgi:cytosine/adenosine deaminase-related metal-dependent hydrolase